MRLARTSIGKRTRRTKHRHPARQLGDGSPRLGPDAPIPLHWFAGFATLLGLVIWGAALVVALDRPLRLWIPVAVVAAIFAVITAEDFFRTGARLHLRTHGRWGRCIALGAGVVVGLAWFWVGAHGLWSPERPVQAWSAVLATVAIPVPTVLLVWLAGCTMVAGLQQFKLTPQSAESNLLLVQAMYYVVGVLTVAIPVFMIGRLELLQPENSGLVAISSLAMIPSIVGAVVWVLDNNTTHLREQARNVPPDLDKITNDADDRERRNQDRLRQLDAHVTFQNRWAIGVLLLAAGWVVTTILS